MAPGKHRADVLIIGGGLAGIVTAIELLEAGRSVLIVDRAGEAIFGGQAREALGGMIFADTPEQRRAGVKDTPELLLGDWLRYTHLREDQTWPRAWARPPSCSSSPTTTSPGCSTARACRWRSWACPPWTAPRCRPTIA